MPYYATNMDLVFVELVFNLYEEDWPIRTHQLQYLPAKFVFTEEQRRGIALDSIASMGSIISGGCVNNSVLSHGVRVNSCAMVENSIIFAHAVIGSNSRICRAIIDRGVCIPPTLKSVSILKMTGKDITSQSQEPWWSCLKLPVSSLHSICTPSNVR